MKCSACITILCLFFAVPVAGSELVEDSSRSVVDITVTNLGFSPQVLKIPVNTDVLWTNIEGVHTTTSYDGLWDSGVLVANESFGYTFDTVGLFRYHDTIHDWPAGLIEVVHSLAEIDVFTDKGAYFAGDLVRTGLELTNPSAAFQAGIYVWLESPDATITWLLAIPSITIPEGFHYQNESWLTAVLPPILRGEYTLHAAIVKSPDTVMISDTEFTWTFGQAIQTNWTGGHVPMEPVPGWGDNFYSFDKISWNGIEGQLALAGETRPTPLSAPIAFDAGRANSVALADIDGDGKNEVITTDPVHDIYNDWGAVYWWKIDETGTWIQHTVSDTYYGAYHVDTADMDGDDDLDVIVTSYYGDGPELGRNGKYAWFENLSGDASAWREHIVGDLFWGAIYIEAGDIDGDGDMDLTGASELTDGIDEQEADLVWFENIDGQGEEWGQHDVDLFFHNASESHLADLDGDGDIDIVGAWSHPTGPSTFFWWENSDGQGDTLNKRSIPGEFWGAGYLGTGDIDGDGDIDLLGSGYNSSQVGWWENVDGQGTQWQVWLVAVMPSGRGAWLGDLDGDGDLDALIWSYSQVNWVENLDSGYSWQIHYLNYQAYRPFAAAGDVDNDGKLDILMTSEEFTPPHDAQVFWYDITRFKSAGTLVSSVIDGNLLPDWGPIAWDAEIPTGTTMELAVRASFDPENMGDYVTVPNTGYDLSDLIDPNSQYLQYRLHFTSASQEFSPIFRDLNVERGAGD